MIFIFVDLDMTMILDQDGGLLEKVSMIKFIKDNYIRPAQRIDINDLADLYKLLDDPGLANFAGLVIRREEMELIIEDHIVVEMVVHVTAERRP